MSNRRIILFALLIVAGFALGAALAGCGRPASATPTAGTVVDREHDAGEWDTKKSCKKVGTRTKCTKKRVWDPESWHLTIRTGDGRDVAVDVDRDTFEAHPVGSTYTESR